MARHLGADDRVAKALLHTAILKAMTDAVRSGSGSAVVEHPPGSGRKVTVRVRRKAKESEGAEDDWEVEVVAESAGGTDPDG